MSGHLNRMVRSVMQPSETIHPAVGSLFAPTENARLPVESAVEAAARPELQKPHDRAEIPEDAALQPERLMNTEPVTSQSQLTASANRRPEARVPESRSSQPRPENEREARPAFQALLPPSKNRVDTQAVLAPRLAAPSSRSQGKPESAAPSQREPDEIQIHIGRIEVSAVQQPAPAPEAVRNSRKSPSLDEYLRRRDRRAL